MVPRRSPGECHFRLSILAKVTFVSTPIRLKSATLRPAAPAQRGTFAHTCETCPRQDFRTARLAHCGVRDPSVAPGRIRRVLLNVKGTAHRGLMKAGTYSEITRVNAPTTGAFTMIDGIYHVTFSSNSHDV